MKRISKIKLLLSLLTIIPCLGVSALSLAVTLPVPPAYQEQLEILTAEYEKLTQELKNIQVRLNKNAGAAATQEEYEKDVKRLFQLMDDLAKKKKAMNELKQQLNDLFTTPPPLKLVRITGPEPGLRKLVATNPYGYEEEIIYTPNGSGCTRRLKDRSGRLQSSTAFAVTYAPLEINPGEPFHFEVEARAAAYWDQPRDCSAGYEPKRFFVQIDPDNSFSSPTLAMSKADLNCQPGSVTLSMRFKPEPPILPEPGDNWHFPYVMEAVTNGSPVKGRPFGPIKKEISAFRLTTKKSAIDLSDRMWYKFDVSVSPWPFDSPYGGPTITLHYRAQDDAIAFLPQYQFPEDTATLLIAVPDLEGLSKREATDKLTMMRLAARITAGPPPPRSDLSGKVATQTPIPGTKVKLHSEVKIALYANYIPPSIPVPDFRGKPLADAKNWLRANNLEANLKAGRPAPSSDQSGTIESQDPPPGTKLQRDKRVELEVYGPYNPKVFVPDVAGLSVKDAKAKLEATGLKVNLVASGPAPSDSLSFKVKEAEPKAGDKVAPGTEVTVKVYGKYSTPLMVVPGVEGLSFSDAKNRLIGAGLKVSAKAAEPAPSKDRSDRVKSQKPSAGTQVNPNSEIEIWVFGKYIPTKEEQVAAIDCSRFQGSKAYWDNAAQKPLCGCFEGLQWNLAKTQCVTADVQANEMCTRDYPGSIAQGRTADGKINCDCPQGTVWNTNRTRCIKKPTGGSGSEDCPCVDEQGRRYRMGLGLDCGQQGAWRDYNCPSSTGGKRQPPTDTDTGTRTGSRSDSQNQSNCYIDVAENIHNYKYFFVTRSIAGRSIRYGVVPSASERYFGGQAISGPYGSQPEAIRKARELCPNGKIAGKGYSY